MCFSLWLYHKGEVKEQKDCIPLLQEILVLLLSTISLSCSKQCCYEGTPRSFHIHFSTHWYPIALFLNKRSISRSLASALMVNATESYPLCFSGRGNTSKDALPFFPQIFFFLGGGGSRRGQVCVCFQLLPLFSPTWWLVISVFTKYFLSTSISLFTFLLSTILGCKLFNTLGHQAKCPLITLSLSA